MATAGKNRLLKNKLLIGEGRDEQKFLTALLKQVGIDDVQVEEYGGKSNLSNYLKEFRIRPGRSRIRSIGITRDVDKSLAQDFQSVRDTLLRSQFPGVPQTPGQILAGNPSIGIFMFPDNVRTGELEDLCMDAAGDDPAIQCIEDFFACVTNRTKRIPSSLGKARIHAWLSSQNKPDLRLGEAAQKDWWPWEHSAFEPLKVFVRNL